MKFGSSIKINKPLSELNEQLVKDIFSQMDYVFFLLFNRMKYYDIRYINKNDISKESLRYNDIAKELAFFLKENHKKINNVITKYCLDERRKLIEEILYKNAQKNNV